MAAKITQTEEIKKFLNVVSGMTSDKGNPRVKEIVHRILTDLFNTIEDLDVRPYEFWAAVDYFNDLGQHMEAGLLTPGLGLEHFLDLRMDAEDKAAGVKQGTPPTIEGPLYVANAPLSKGSARLDDGTDKGEVLFMHGVVRDLDGKPVAAPSSTYGTPIQRACTPSSTKARANTIFDGASKPVQTAATNSVPSCLPAMVVRQTDRPSAF
jgi:catechol 1,2-dioxygenase